jgi:K+-sensing histidine kinase KdpD
LRELNELKSRFYTMAAHEVRMPLAIILTSTQLLRNYQDRMSVERQLEYFNRIEAQVWCLTEMTEDALTVNQADSMGMAFNPERLNIESFCRTVVDETRPTVSTHKIQFTVNGKCEL